MCDFVTILLVAIAGFLFGIFVMMIGIKFYLSVQYPMQFVEDDDWPKEDWVIGYEVTDDEL